MDLAALDETKTCDGIYLALSKQVRMTKGGKPYVCLTLGDKTGQVEARIWEVADPRIDQDFGKGDVVKVRAYPAKFDGGVQLKVEKIKLLQQGEYERGDLLPATTRDVAAMWASLEQSIASFTDPDLKRLVETMLAAPGVRKAVLEAPAAKQLHHAFLGGLLEHVVSLLGLAEKVVPHYPMLMLDLVRTGVILHDIGKIHELAWVSGFEYTLEGTLLGHIQIGASMAERAMESLPGFPPRLKTLVLHMILSHHGKLEFGSPKLPMIPEALMLNFLDDMDAKMQTVEAEFQKAARQGKGAGEMTDRVWALDQRTMLDSRAWLREGVNGNAKKSD